jgi:hypothetical protein
MPGGGAEGEGADLRVGVGGIEGLPAPRVDFEQTRASANGARAGGGSASIWGWEYSSVVTWYIPRGLRSDPGAAAGLGQ